MPKAKPKYKSQPDALLAPPPRAALFLDLSLSCTGWAVISPEGLYSGRQSFIKTPKGRDPAIRYHHFAEWLTLLMDAHKVEEVWYEEPHLAHKNAICALWPLVSRVQMECAIRSIPYHCLHTQMLKRLATGYGNADKEDTKTAAAALLPHYDPEADGGGDEADAICLMMVRMKGPDNE